MLAMRLLVIIKIIGGKLYILNIVGGQNIMTYESTKVDNNFISRKYKQPTIILVTAIGIV